MDKVQVPAVHTTIVVLVLAMYICLLSLQHFLFTKNNWPAAFVVFHVLVQKPKTDSRGCCMLPAAGLSLPCLSVRGNAVWYLQKLANRLVVLGYAAAWSLS